MNQCLPQLVAAANVNATMEDKSKLFLNDLVSLPIIISDYDAIEANKSQTSPLVETTENSKANSEASDTASSYASSQSWTTGFTDFADEIWKRMTSGMKLKLREACVEVLRRTDDASEDEKIRWQYDNDARFLD